MSPTIWQRKKNTFPFSIRVWQQTGISGPLFTRSQKSATLNTMAAKSPRASLSRLCARSLHLVAKIQFQKSYRHFSSRLASFLDHLLCPSAFCFDAQNFYSELRVTWYLHAKRIRYIIVNVLKLQQTIKVARYVEIERERYRGGGGQTTYTREITCFVNSAAVTNGYSTGIDYRSDSAGPCGTASLVTHATCVRGPL